MIIGIDNGNALTKTLHTQFVSGVVAHDTNPYVSSEILEYKGKFYTIASKRSVYKEDKTVDEECFILTLFAIAKEVFARNEYSPKLELDLACGLPPQFYGLRKDDFKKYMLSQGKEVDFSYQGKPFHITIKSVTVYPQAFSAVATHSNILSEYSRFFIIDIGGFTVDCLLCADKQFTGDKILSLPNGINTLNDKIKERVRSAFGKSIEDIHIRDILQNKPTVLSKEIKDVISSEVEAYSKELVLTLLSNGIDLTTNPAVFLGGGSVLLRKYLEENDNIAKIFFIDDVKANADGYEILLKRAMERNKKVSKEDKK